MAWTSKPPFGTMLDMTHPMNNGLVSCWVLNEGNGNTITDLSGNGNNGTILNMASPPTLTSGWQSSGRLGGPLLSFDGIDDRLVVTKNPTININNGTISIWVYPRASAVGSVMIARAYSFDWNRIIYGIIRDNTGQWRAYLADGTGSYATALEFGAINLNEWSHLVFSFENTGISTILKTYKNGSYVSSTSVNFTVGSQCGFGYGCNYDRDLGIGAIQNASYFFTGSIDEIRIWNRVLSDIEISSLNINPYQMFVESTTCPQPTCNMIIQ